MSACYALAMIPSITHLSFLSYLLFAISDRVQSDISLIHPNDINWFLTCDETHHPFSNEGHKGGPPPNVIRRACSSTRESGVLLQTHRLEAFGKWCGDGSKADNHNHPIMSRMSAVAIVKVLMPKVALTWKLANYTTLKTCTKWLGELAGGMTWVDKMKAMEEGNELNPTALFDSYI